jgi:hypothetical protein
MYIYIYIYIYVLYIYIYINIYVCMYIYIPSLSVAGAQLVLLGEGQTTVLLATYVCVVKLALCAAQGREHCRSV